MPDPPDAIISHSPITHDTPCESCLFQSLGTKRTSGSELAGLGAVNVFMVWFIVIVYCFDYVKPYVPRLLVRQQLYL